MIARIVLTASSAALGLVLFVATAAPAAVPSQHDCTVAAGTSHACIADVQLPTV